MNFNMKQLKFAMINCKDSPDRFSFSVGEIPIWMGVVDWNRLALNFVTPSGEISKISSPKTDSFICDGLGSDTPLSKEKKVTTEHHNDSQNQTKTVRMFNVYQINLISLTLER